MMSDWIFTTIYGLLLFVFIPYIAGGLFCLEEKKGVLASHAFRFLAGFAAMLAVWEILTLGFTLFFAKRPFHELRYAYGVALGIMVAFRVFIIVKKRISPKRELQDMASSLRNLFSDRSALPSGLVFFLFFIWQLWGVIFHARVYYIDDMYYVPRIGDIVYMDQLYTKSQLGSTLTSLAQFGEKSMVAAWNTFMAYLSVTMKQHPLFICRTLVPAYLVVLTYIALYLFGRFLFHKETGKVWTFLAWSIIIIRAFSTVGELYTLEWYAVFWGKMPLGIMLTPVIFLAYQELAEGEVKLSDKILMLTLGGCAAAFSMMAIVVTTLQLLFMMFATAKYSGYKKAMTLAVWGEAVIVLQAVIYIVIHYGILKI